MTGPRARVDRARIDRSCIDPYVPHRGDPAFRVVRYELDLDYRTATNALDGTALLHVVAVEDLDRLELDLVGLHVAKVLVDGRRPASYRHRGSRLVVRLAAPLRAGGTCTVQVRYGGEPRAQRGPWGEVGWEELTDGVIVAGQPDGAPTWFPCHDHPSGKASFRLAVRTESAYEVVACGLLVDRRTGASRTTWTYEQAEPTPTYLATLQVGRYVRRELAATPVPQVLVHPPALQARAVADTARQPEMMAVFERLFGPYPFASYVLVVTEDDLEIPLEAQAMSVFGANHVDGAQGSERLVAHELAHQWFGNSLTVSAWRHLWLHEGFACYAEWLWSQESGGPSADRHARRAHDRLAGLPQDLLLCDPGPDLMFDDRLYKRGALALHAVRVHAGDAAFFDLLRDWTSAHRHGSVTTELFVAHCVRHLGPDAADVLSEWLDDARLPPLSVGAARPRRARPGQPSQR